MPALTIALLVLAVAAMVWRPRGGLSIVVAAAAVAVDLIAGQAGRHEISEALRSAVPLGIFLTAVIWVAAVAKRAGAAERVAAAIRRVAGARRIAVYLWAGAACALLTAVVSLDGAVVLMVPLVAALAEDDAEMRQPLLFGAVAVANAFSLALPEGNPTNIVVMIRLHLSPDAYVSHLFLPGLVATAVCVVLPALALRPSLRGRMPIAGPRIVVPGARGGMPRPAMPWRIVSQVALLAILAGALPGSLSLPATTSLPVLLLVGLGASVASGAANNLPASVALSGVLGAPGGAAYAALVGLSVGALATPHGSVATLIAFDRADAHPPWRRYLAVLGPAAVVAVVAAVATLSLGLS